MTRFMYHIYQKYVSKLHLRSTHLVNCCNLSLFPRLLKYKSRLVVMNDTVGPIMRYLNLVEEWNHYGWFPGKDEDDPEADMDHGWYPGKDEDDL